MSIADIYRTKHAHRHTTLIPCYILDCGLWGSVRACYVLQFIDFLCPDHRTGSSWGINFSSLELESIAVMISIISYRLELSVLSHRPKFSLACKSFDCHCFEKFSVMELSFFHCNFYGLAVERGGILYVLCIFLIIYTGVDVKITCLLDGSNTVHTYSFCSLL